jgi:hypothetical protein
MTVKFSRHADQPFSDFADQVYAAMIDHQRIKPLAATWKIPADDDFSQAPVIPRPYRKIFVSWELMNELRFRRPTCGVDLWMEDHCDGKGPRTRWFSIVCEWDDALDGQSCRLEE